MKLKSPRAPKNSLRKFPKQIALELWKKLAC
ncbi:hypothetical protein NEOC65_002075 [Neochlamydia sp. AcF65]|nr:hypothetical protein [Neochlamydia sp. AcF65]MBS4170390.1 hypothetical protein [Neochlamydia sp. AcF95]